MSAIFESLGPAELLLIVVLLAPWILGLIRAAQNAHWGWFVLGILFWPVAVAYLLTHLRRPSRPPAAPPPPAFTP